MYLDKSILEINELLKNKTIKPIDLVKEAFERLEKDGLIFGENIWILP